MVRELFEMARTKKACIIFFDEIDAIGGWLNDETTVKQQWSNRQTTAKKTAQLFPQVPGLMTAQVATTRFNELCWNLLTNWMVLIPEEISKY